MFQQQSKPDCRDVAVQSSPDGAPTVAATTGKHMQDTTQHLLTMVASALYMGHSLSIQCRKSLTYQNLDELGLYIVSAEILTHSDFRYSILFWFRAGAR